MQFLVLKQRRFQRRKKCLRRTSLRYDWSHKWEPWCYLFELSSKLEAVEEVEIKLIPFVIFMLGWAAAADRKEKGWDILLGVCGREWGSGEFGVWTNPEADWLLAEDKERLRFQQSGCSFFCSSAITLQREKPSFLNLSSTITSKWPLPLLYIYVTV